MGTSPNHAFSQIHREHIGRVLALCRRLLGSQAAAEDASHEALLRAERSFSSYDPSRPFGPWILRIAANMCIDELRRRKREQRLFEPLDEETQSHEPAMDFHSPLTQMLVEEERRVVRQALGDLPLRERTLVSLRYEAEMSYEEIGRAVGLQANHVGVLIHRAKARLRSALAELGRAASS